jgi:DNA invertase Pin-like site-specific DNA recombinase
MLEEYARRNGFDNVKHFTDDGITGTIFNRPGLNALVEEVKAGRVATVIIKDQSRIGRDVIEVGLLKRTFDEYNVRFIAAEDNLDTANGFDIMSIFRDVINEFYVADTSRKIKAVFKARMQDGKRVSPSVPYGYLRDPNDKQKLIIDPEPAEVVKRIYRLVMEGKGVVEIANILSADNVLIPAAYAEIHCPENNHSKGYIKRSL